MILLNDILKYIVSFSEQPITIKVADKLIRPVENDVICGDHSLITSDLGWEPEYDLKETIKEMVDYFRKKAVNQHT